MEQALQERPRTDEAEAHEEALKGNAAINDAEAKIREIKGVFEPNYESLPPEKISAFNLPEMEGKPFSEVVEYVKEKYGDKYYIPGVEYRDYLIQNPEKIRSTPLEDEGRSLFFVGDEHGKGTLEIPCGIFTLDDNGKFYFDDHKEPSSLWSPGYYRVVLIKK